MNDIVYEVQVYSSFGGEWTTVCATVDKEFAETKYTQCVKLGYPAKLVIVVKRHTP